MNKDGLSPACVAALNSYKDVVTFFASSSVVAMQTADKVKAYELVELPWRGSYFFNFTISRGINYTIKQSGYIINNNDLLKIINTKYQGPYNRSCTHYVSGGKNVLRRQIIT